MKLFIDSGNLRDIEALVPLGIIDGVTTNPSLLAKEGGDARAIVRRICEIVQGPVSAEVVATDATGMIAEGRELAGIDEHVVVKVPFTRDGVRATKVLAGEGHLRAIHHLVDEQKVADEQRPLHAAARNLERLDEERAHEEKEHDGDDERLRPLEEQRPVRTVAPIDATQRLGAMLLADGGTDGLGGGGLGHRTSPPATSRMESGSEVR